MLADRLALALFNRRQIGAKDFVRQDNGAVLLTDDGRKTVLPAWQERKRTERRIRFSTKSRRSAWFRTCRRSCCRAPARRSRRLSAVVLEVRGRVAGSRHL